MGDAVHIRTYRDEDLPAVLDLLRAALGEPALLQRTPELFRWKHIDNPYGRSVMLVAEADDTIVGLRTFMRWELEYKGQIIPCGRAVDTATHPAYLRRGIFTNLTSESIDVAREVGMRLIFNTPNQRSKPGYLKMGWSEVGPIGVLVRPHPTRLFATQTTLPTLDQLIPSAERVTPTQPVVATPRTGHDPEPDGLRTNRSDAYMSWRFAQHPTARYGAIRRPSGTAIVRANLRNGRPELVISDALGTDPTAAVVAATRSSRAAYDVASFPRGSIERRAAYRAALLPVPGVAALHLVANPIGDVEFDVTDLNQWRVALSDLELL